MSDSRKNLIFIVLPVLLAVCCIVGIFFIAAHTAKYNPAGGDKFTKDFYYRIEDGRNESYVKITGLTPLAAEKKNLIIPAKIDDLSVRRTSYEKGCGTRNSIVSNNLQSLYLPQTLLANISLFSLPDLSKVVLYNYTESYENELREFALHELYVQSPVRVYVSSHFGEMNVEGIKIHVANVSYMYNYDGAFNYGYYFIDNYDGGELISFVPPEPTRTGYRFEGWYKESTCVNEWNFGDDRLPQDIDTSDDVDIKLYAKWSRE